MCIGIAKKEGVKIPKQRLLNCYVNNKDGCGFAFVKKVGAFSNDNQLLISKGYSNFLTFWQDFDRIQNAPDTGAMLVHFRIATSGKIDYRNTHPFRIDKRHAVIHNGVFNRFSVTGSPHSDTAIFTHRILRPMFAKNADLFRESCAKYLIEEAIGTWNKIVILSANGDFVIYNEDRGYWIEGVWYSNTSFYPKIYTYHTSKKKERGRKAKEKPSHYCKAGENVRLTMAQINKLTHTHHCKLVDLVQRKIVEPVFENDENSSTSTSNKSQAYIDFWRDREEKAEDKAKISYPP